MPSPESSLLATADDNNYNLEDDDAVATFIKDLSVGSLFTKALLLVVVIFVVCSMCMSIYRRCRNHRRHHDGEEGPIQNNAAGETTISREADIEAAINSYPCFMYGDKKDDDHRNDTTCPICMCEYLESEMMRMMPQCGHYFHLKCIDEWLRINWSCPVCRDSPTLPRATPS